MGQIGKDILDNDEAQDIHYLYFEKYNAGKTTSEIESCFKLNYSDYFAKEIIEENSNFWFGHAMAQWETKALSPFVKNMVNKIVSQDIEAASWEGNFLERKNHLKKFIKKISTEKKTAKKPVKQRLFKAPFLKGDVVTSPIDETKWGIMLCLANSEGLQKMGKCLFAVTTIEKDSPGTMEDVISARINNESGDDDFCSEISCSDLSSLSAELGEYEELEKLIKIGTVNVERTFNMEIYPSKGWGNPLESKYSDSENITLTELISKPDHKYTEWAEYIVSSYGLSHD